MRAATRLGEPSISVICTGTSEDGQKLASLSEINAKIGPKRARNLLGCAVSISHHELFELLKDQKVLDNWKESAYLRFNRTLHFDNGITKLGDYTLYLHSVTGLTVTKKGAIDTK